MWPLSSLVVTPKLSASTTAVDPRGRPARPWPAFPASRPSPRAPQPASRRAAGDRAAPQRHLAGQPTAATAASAGPRPPAPQTAYPVRGSRRARPIISPASQMWYSTILVSRPIAVTFARRAATDCPAGSAPRSGRRAGSRPGERLMAGVPRRDRHPSTLRSQVSSRYAARSSRTRRPNRAGSRRRPTTRSGRKRNSAKATNLSCDVLTPKSGSATRTPRGTAVRADHVLRLARPGWTTSASVAFEYRPVATAATPCHSRQHA